MYGIFTYIYYMFLISMVNVGFFGTNFTHIRKIQVFEHVTEFGKKHPVVSIELDLFKVMLYFLPW